MFSPAAQRLGVGASGGGSGDHHRPGPRSRRDKGPHARGRTLLLLLLWVGFRAAMPGPGADTEAPGVGVCGARRSTDPTQRIPPPGILGPVAEAVCLCQSHKLWFGSPCGSRGCEPQTLSLESSELGPGPGHQEPQFLSDFRAPLPPGMSAGASLDRISWARPPDCPGARSWLKLGVQGDGRGVGLEAGAGRGGRLRIEPSAGRHRFPERPQRIGPPTVRPGSRALCGSRRPPSLWLRCAGTGGVGGGLKQELGW